MQAAVDRIRVIQVAHGVVGHLRAVKAAAQHVQPLLDAATAVPCRHTRGDEPAVHAEQRQQLIPIRRRPAAQRKGQARVGHQTAAEHQCVAARLSHAALRVGRRPDLAIGHHGNGHGLADERDAVPVRRRPVAVQLGACMHNEFSGTGVGDGVRAVQHAAVVAVTQAHLGRHRHVRRHGAAHCGHDLVHEFRLVQQHRAAAMAVDSLGRAAEVEVDAIGLQRGQQRRVVGQAGGVGTQQLRAHRRARWCAAALKQFRHQPGVHTRRQQLVGDADEFRHAAVDATHPCEHVAQAVVEHTFHGGEQDQARMRRGDCSQGGA